MSREWIGVVIMRRVAAVVIAVLLCAGLPGDGTFAGADVGVDAGMSAFAVRGARTQLVPLPGPPMLCSPGSYVHAVETLGNRLVAFTFDDGPWLWATESIMTTLEQRGGRGTFFMIGGLALTYPAIARSVVARGHEVGNHTMNHYRDGYRISTEIATANAQIGAVVGVLPRLFRSPGLVKSSLIQNELARLGMCNFFGNILPGDTNLPVLSATALCNTFKAQLRPGAIVMLHDGGNHPQTVAAMTCMADHAVRNGYRMVTLSDLMGQGYWTY